MGLRNLSVIPDSFKVLSRSGITGVSIQEEINYAALEGKLFTMMLGAFATYSSDASPSYDEGLLRERALRG